MTDTGSLADAHMRLLAEAIADVLKERELLSGVKGAPCAATVQAAGLCLAHIHTEPFFADPGS